MKRRPPSRQARQRCAILIRELAVPAPFELGRFARCLERQTGRYIEMIPAVMTTSSPSGARVRTAGADYLYYEEETSPYHQAHIMLFLAAGMLLAAGPGPSVDPRVTPDVSPQLLRLMLPGTTGGTVDHLEAETFAFLALKHVGLAALPLPLAWRAIRQLGPLRSGLSEAVPEVASARVSGPWPASTLRLHQQVIEIRDAALALRPFRDQEVASDAAKAGRAAGLAGDDLDAAVEGAVLAAAVRARNAGHPVRQPDDAAGPTTAPGRDLRSEASWLAKVSRAFSDVQRAGAPASGDGLANTPDGLSPGWIREAASHVRCLIPGLTVPASQRKVGHCGVNSPGGSNCE